MFDAGSSAVTWTDFSPDGRFVFSAGADGTPHIWNAQTGQQVARFTGHGTPVNGAAQAPDGSRILTVGLDGGVLLWDTGTGAQLQRLQTLASAEQAAISPDGRYGAVSVDAHGTFLYDLQTGSLVMTYTDQVARREPQWCRLLARRPLPGNHTPSRCERLARDVRTGAAIRQFTGAGDWATGVTFSADGKYILAGDLDKVMRLWDAATGRLVQQFAGHSDAVWGVAFSHDGKYVLSGSADGTARLWDVATGQELRRFQGHTGTVWSVAFSPDDREVLTGSEDGTARLWYTQLDDVVSYLCSMLPRDFTPDERAQFEIRDTQPTCPNK